MTPPTQLWQKIVQKLTNLLDCPDFVAAHRSRPQDFTRRRHLTFKNTVLFLLNQPRTALQTELDPFFQALNGSDFEQRVVTAQAFSQARNKLKHSALESLNQALQQQIDQLGLRQRWQGLQVLAIDGSSVHLPLESGMHRAFGTHCGHPVARLSELYDVNDQQSLHSLIVSPGLSERDCAHLHLDHTPADSVTLFDRGYPAQWLMALYVQQNRHFVMRLPRDYTTEVKQFLASGKLEEIRTFAAKSSHSRLMCSESGTDPNLALQLRIIRVELDSGETELLLTTLLDAQAYPVEQFAGLYNRRWGIETDFRRTKITLELDNFSGRTPLAVKQDFHATLLVKNLVLLMQYLLQPVVDQAQTGSKWRWKVNFTQAVSRMKNSLVKLLNQPCAQGWHNLLTLMAGCLSVVRPGRRYPRHRKRPASRGCEGYKPTR